MKNVMILCLVVLVAILGYDDWHVRHAPKDSYVEQTKFIRAAMDQAHAEAEYWKSRAHNSLASADTIRKERIIYIKKAHEKISDNFTISDSAAHALFLYNFAR